MKAILKQSRQLALAGLIAAMIGGTVSAQTLTMGVRAGPDSMAPHWSTLGGQARRRHVCRRWPPQRWPALNGDADIAAQS